MTRDGALAASAIRVDGGMAANDWFCQFLADILAARVERPAGLEATVTGAAFLAGLAAGVWADLPAIAACVQTAVTFSPRMSASRRATLIRGWRDALARALPGRRMADATNA
jgi:glycerol kinase